jgi:AcrR family transcriptional regulator
MKYLSQSSADVNTGAYFAMSSDHKANAGADRWVELARATLLERGVEAVRVEALARDLGVTKGSFYTRFRDRDDLLQQVLKDWERCRVDEVISASKDGDADALTQLRRLFLEVTLSDGRLERAIRVWATIENRAADAVKRIDQRRFQHLKQLFRDIGFPEKAARDRARLSYLARLGLLLTVEERTLRERKALATANLAILVNPHDTAATL